MSGYAGGFGGSRGPGDGYDGGPDDGPYGTPASASSASSRVEGSNFPAWGVVLVLGGAGMVMVCVWLCVRSICLKLRARRRSAVRDLEAQQSERYTARMLREGDAKEVENQAKPCEADVGVQMTFVVMAGEDQPSYLACPATPATPVPSIVPEEFEKKEHRQSATSCPPPNDFSRAPTLNPNPPLESYQKTPPSPS